MKYSMVTINRKVTDFGGLLIRRVLIQYENKNASDPADRTYIRYYGTRLIEVDPYFKDNTMSHKYQFEDDGYTLLNTNNIDSTLLNLKRAYHYSNRMDTYEQEECQPIEFEAASDEEATELFNNRID